MKFEILKRKHSSNVIVRLSEKKNEQGKTFIDRDIVICPTVNKKDGDVLAQKIVDLLNAQNI